MTAQDDVLTQQTDLSQRRRALVDKRLRDAREEHVRRGVIPHRAPDDFAPLSFAQQRLWFFDQLEPGSPLYNMPVALRLRGRLNCEALRKAINAVVGRHQSLRTRFVAEDGCPVQIITPLPRAGAELPVKDLSQVPEPLREEKLRELLHQEARRPFALSRGGLLRVWLARLGAADHALLVNMHHIASDAWSFGIFLRELSSFYRTFDEGKQISSRALPIQYADFVMWQRATMQGRRMEEQLAFWKTHLAGAPQILELPPDKPRPSSLSFRGATAERALAGSLAGQLKRLAQAEGATLFMTLLAAFEILLRRYTRQSQLLVGTPIAGRTQLETEDLIGFFVNTLALRADLSGNPTFRELLARVRQEALEAYAHQDLPFERLVEELQPARSPGRTPLIQVMFVLQNEMGRELQLPELSVKPIPLGTDTAKFDLTLAVEDRLDELLVQVEYNTDLFTEATITRLLCHFQLLLEGIVANPSQRIDQLPLLTDAERHQVLVEWSGVQTPYPRDKTVAQLFEEQVEKAPDAVAVYAPGTSASGHEAGVPLQKLTYRELNQRANQLARRLQNLGIGSGASVGVCLERSAEMVVALLAVLKVGGAYASLEPSHPKERLAFMLEELRATVLLTQEKFYHLFGFDSQNPASGFQGPHIVCLESELKAVASQSPKNLVGGADADTPAYVSFTSGSTGKPKGVVVPHRGVVRLVKATNYARFEADETFLQLAPLAFDASTFEIWGALLNGARLVVFPAHTPALAELSEFIRDHGITTLWLTAGLFHELAGEHLGHLRGVRQLLAGGDVLSPPHVKLALEHLPGCRLINGYGPTENTTFTCCHEISTEECAGRSIPIGRPIANTQVYVLDEHLQPVPVGLPGELCIAGDGLALGYLNRPRLTGEKFVPNPFDIGVQTAAGPGPFADAVNPETRRRLYKTGDLARWLPDGTLDFLGRMDQQVKIRGFRVEPGEVEAVLSEHPAVRTCAVTVWDDHSGGKQLAAYFVPDSIEPPSAETFRAYLAQKLPDYMIPIVFVPLKSLPLNGNGKLERGALPRPEHQWSRPNGKYVAPRNEVEGGLVKIWEEVLGLHPIGVEDHFFDLGGHSLLAVRLVARIEKGCGKKIPVAAVFKSPTVTQMARALNDDKNSVMASSIIEIQPRGARLPLFFVHGAGGGMLWGYTNLSRCLGPGQPVYAFNSRGLSGQEEFASIERMAAQYVADLREFQPHGPYCLGGYCFGGNIAYEMARQLEADGEEVALLALMNCAAPNSSYARIKWTPLFVVKFVRNLFTVGIAALRDTPEQRKAFFRWAGHWLQNRAARLFKGRLGRRRLQGSELEDFVNEIQRSLDLPSEVRGLWKVHLRALIDYHPQPYAGRITLLRSRNHPALCSFDPRCGWDELAAGGVNVKIVPGSHESILNERNARSVAALLEECLREVQASQPQESPL